MTSIAVTPSPAAALTPKSEPQPSSDNAVLDALSAPAFPGRDSSLTLGQLLVIVASIAMEQRERKSHYASILDGEIASEISLSRRAPSGERSLVQDLAEPLRRLERHGLLELKNYEPFDQLESALNLDCDLDVLIAEEGVRVAALVQHRAFCGNGKA